MAETGRDADLERRTREPPPCPRPSAAAHRHQPASTSESDYRRSLQQLRAVESELQQLASENARLKSKLGHAEHEVSAWETFARLAVNQFCADGDRGDPFPEDDGDAQRHVLSGLFARALAPRDVDISQHPDYIRVARECSDVKSQLREVTQRCDKLHATVRSRARRDRATAPANAGALHALGQHVRELNRLTRRMKRDCAPRLADDSDC